MIKYYIETSIGRVYFFSNNIKKMKIKKDYYQTSDDMYIFYSTLFENNEQFTTFEEMFSWDKMKIKDTKNGMFLTIIDRCINYAEYKVYKHYNWGENGNYGIIL